MSDVLLIGGGAVGLSLAYELSARGRRVCLLERAAGVGQESSWAGAGILPAAVVRPHDPPLVQLAGHSVRLHVEWAERLRRETGIDNGYRRCGSLNLADDAATLATLEAEAAHWRDQGTICRSVDAAVAADLEPAIVAAFRDGRIRAAYHVPAEAQVRNPRHVRALATACAARGVELVTDAAVEEFVTRGDELVEVRTRRGSYSAKQYVLCTGAWTGDLAARFGVQVAVKPIRGQIVLLRTPAPVIRGIVMVGRHYFVPRDDGRVLVGSTEEDVGFDKSNTEEAVERLKQFAYELAPALRSAEVERTWAGLRPYAVDDRPYLGRVPALQNAYVAAGHYRWGLTLSTGTAVVMTQLLLGEPPLVDLSEFRVNRTTEVR